MTAVRRGVEHDIGGASFDPAFEHRLQRFVRGVRRLEGEVVAKEDEAEIRVGAHMGERARQGGEVLAMDFHELEPRDLMMDGLDQRALAHAARAPEQRVVGGEALREAERVGEERIPHAVDALEQRQLHAVDVGYRLKAAALRLPDESLCGGEIGPSRPARSEALQRARNPLQNAGEGLLKVHVAPVAKPIGAAIVAPPSRGPAARRQAGHAVEGGNP